MPSRKTILILHLAGQIPLAGVLWQALHYLVGLRDLGHDVYYAEESGAPPYDPRVRSNVADPTYMSPVCSRRSPVLASPITGGIGTRARTGTMASPAIN